MGAEEGAEGRVDGVGSVEDAGLCGAAGGKFDGECVVFLGGGEGG